MSLSQTSTVCTDDSTKAIAGSIPADDHNSTSYSSTNNQAVYNAPPNRAVDVATSSPAIYNNSTSRAGFMDTDTRAVYTTAPNTAVSSATGSASYTATGIPVIGNPVIGNTTSNPISPNYYTETYNSSRFNEVHLLYKSGKVDDAIKLSIDVLKSNALLDVQLFAYLVCMSVNSKKEQPIIDWLCTMTKEIYIQRYKKIILMNPAARYLNVWFEELFL